MIGILKKAMEVHIECFDSQMLSINYKLSIREQIQAFNFTLSL